MLDCSLLDQILPELNNHEFNMTATARTLGMERSDLHKKCGQLKLDVEAVRPKRINAGDRNRNCSPMVGQAIRPQIQRGLSGPSR